MNRAITHSTVLETAAVQAAPVPAKTVWMNEDNQHFYDGNFHGDDDMSEQGLRALVDSYADTGALAGILFCVNMQRALYDSDVWERFKDQKTDYSYQAHLRLLSDRKIDHLAIWLDQARKRGVGAWLTMRMNDAHGLEEVGFDMPLPAHATITLWPSLLWRNHPEWRRATYRREHSLESAFNFLVPEVREHTLRLIEEVLGRWDMDGLELDWMRWGVYFPPGREEEGRAVLNDFMAKVKEYKTAAEKRLGHLVKIGHRLLPDPDVARRSGFDVKRWNEMGVADRFTLAGFGNETSDAAPIWLWKALMKPGTEIFCGLTYGGAGSCLLNGVSSRAIKRGAASAAWANGADAVTLFNECYAEPKNMAELAQYMRDISSPATLTAVGWRSPVTCEPTYLGMSAKRMFPAPILQRFTGHTFDRFGHAFACRITTGEVPADAKVTLSVVFDAATSVATAEAIEARVNGVKCERLETLTFDPAKRFDQTKSWLSSDDWPRDAAVVVRYAVPASALSPRDNAVEFIPPEAKTGSRGSDRQVGNYIWADLEIVPHQRA